MLAQEDKEKTEFVKDNVRTWGGKLGLVKERQAWERGMEWSHSEPEWLDLL